MIIITGASSGIGQELASLFSKEKDVILISRRDPCLPFAKWIKCDLQDKLQISNLIKTLKGYKKNIELIIHCAGVMKSCSSSSLNIEHCIESFMVNTIAPLTITSALTKEIAKCKGKVIVISSIASKLDIPGEAIYSSTKAALDKGFELLSSDLSRLGGTFIKIHPCMIDTPMTSSLTLDQKNYMHNKRSTRNQPTAKELAEYIFKIKNQPNYITGSSIYFGGIRK